MPLKLSGRKSIDFMEEVGYILGNTTVDKSLFRWKIFVWWRCKPKRKYRVCTPMNPCCIYISNYPYKIITSDATSQLLHGGKDSTFPRKTKPPLALVVYCGGNEDWWSEDVGSAALLMKVDKTLESMVEGASFRNFATNCCICVTRAFLSWWYFRI